MKEIEKILKKLKDFKPEIALILGSGFNSAISLENAVEFDYEKIGFKFQKIEGHNRKFVIGEYKGIKALIASRFHFYETGDANNILNLYKVLKELGVKTIVSTTAVGAINEEFNAGDLMLVKSHINLTGTNPLIGKFPVEFVDLSNAYDKTLRQYAIKSAKRLKIPLFEGVHLQVSGPSYETYAEVNAFRKLGADTVSMSSALDAICIASLGMKNITFAGVTNKAVKENDIPITHDEVVKNGQEIGKNFAKIIDNIWHKLI